MADLEKRKRLERPNIVGDRLNVLLLTYLYTIQSVPCVMSEAVSLILQNRNVSYTDQAEFSLVQYAKCFKLLWAPVVDCLYSRKFGRRKTWVIPIQYLIGTLFSIISMNADTLLGSDDGVRKPRIHALTLTLFSCVFLSSTQDVAVDGWSLTILKKRNVGHAGICANVGSSIGHLLGFILFITLESKVFCNKFRSVPQDYGFISFSGFIFLWCAVFMITTTFLLYKKEGNLDQNENECRIGLKESYKRLWKIIRNKPVQEMCILLLTLEVGSAPVNGVVPLKLIDAGVPSDTLALLGVPAIPFELIAPFVLSRFLTGNRAMRTFVISNAMKLLLGIVFSVFIYFTPFVRDENNQLPWWHYWLIVLIYNLHILNDHLMYVALWAFLSRISDPRFGGMYTTLFCATSTIGLRWPISLCLWLVDTITIQLCIHDEMTGAKMCSVFLDGYFIETIVFTTIGIIWLRWAKRRIYQLEDMDTSQWITK